MMQTIYSKQSYETQRILNPHHPQNVEIAKVKSKNLDVEHEIKLFSGINSPIIFEAGWKSTNKKKCLQIENEITSDEIKRIKLEKVETERHLADLQQKYIELEKNDGNNLQ